MAEGGRVGVTAPIALLREGNRGRHVPFRGQALSWVSFLTSRRKGFEE